MLEQISIEKVLFLDIETVSGEEHFEELSPEMQKLWSLKASQRYREEEKTPAELYRHAGIYAEFGKIVCISCGFFQSPGPNATFRVKSYAGPEEHEVLTAFKEMLDKHFSGPDHRLCAHNGKEFDYPYLSRRMLINNIRLPRVLDTPGKKPWEVNHLDTMELWKFGDYKSYTSLDLLTTIFHIPTPKDDIDGSQIRDVFYEENDLERITTYCQKDVVATARLFQRYLGMDIVSDAQIVISE